MTPMDFIKSRLLEIKSEIKGIVLKYMYEKDIDYHTIIVEPSDVYNNDDDYKVLEDRLVWDFYNKFPDSDILVTERTPIINVENVLFEVRSIKWNNTKSKSKFSFGFGEQVDNDYYPCLNSSENNYSLAA